VEARDFQLRAGLELMRNRDVMVVARTGVGKSLIFIVTAAAAQLAGLDGVLFVITPLRALEMDQVSTAPDKWSREEMLTVKPGPIDQRRSRPL
jgi:superfamily II DNA helicase RecQ